MYKIKQLSLEKMREVYDTRMKNDFPPGELKPFFSIELLTKQNQYISFGYISETDELLAYACFVKPENGKMAMLDYYAVDAAQRGTGIGGSFISKFQELFLPMGIDHILLEVECIEMALNSEETQVRTRRIHFYEKKWLPDEQRPFQAV